MAKEPRGVPLVVIVVAGLCAAAGLAYWYAERHLLCDRIASPESCAVAALRTYLGAQNTFRRADYYGIGKNVYANTRDGSGFPDLYQIGGPGPKGDPLRLIDIAFAEATVGGEPRAGYHFADITADAAGPYDYAKQCGLCAVPAAYNRTGRNIFIIDAGGIAYQRDAAALHPGLATGDPVPPLTVWPDATAIASWIPIGSE